eukprot:TRINITY_DN142234_c0_g1_i1.p1 TRINITY_DN142234_c0_g1~~TRINITY_DN142234_c0_g1_i1.p1  ORF type:complete len:167 (-),score=10.19 TRINITY_DN142234_c0_g1_i1:14-460(-)
MNMHKTIFKSRALFLLVATLLGSTAFAGQSYNEKANALFEELFKQDIDRSPIYQGYLGIKDNNDKWDDISDSFAKETLKLKKKQLKKLKSIDTEKLDSATLLSYQLMKKDIEEEIEDFKWRFNDQPVNQMFRLTFFLAGNLRKSRGGV